MYYLIEGVYRALQTLNIREFHSYQLKVIKQDNSYLVKTMQNNNELLCQLVRDKKLNDIINLQLTNYVYSSFVLIRNGIILFFAYFASTIIFIKFLN